jgi:hypothetical protein
MVDLSIGVTDLAATLEKILQYFFTAPVTVHSHRSFKHLLHASEKCPGDVSYLVIACVILLLRSRVRANKTQRSGYRYRLQILSRQQAKFVPFESDQHKVHRNILVFLGYFSDPDLRLPGLKDHDHDHYGIDVIVKWLRRQSLHTDKALTYINWELASPVVADSDSEFLVFDHEASDLCDGRPVEGDPLKRQSPKKSLDQVFDPEVRRLALLFVDWDMAYESAVEVWRVLKEGPQFNYDELREVIEVPFAIFLRAAIDHFQQEQDERENRQEEEETESE